MNNALNVPKKVFSFFRFSVFFFVCLANIINHSLNCQVPITPKPPVCVSIPCLVADSTFQQRHHHQQYQYHYQRISQHQQQPTALFQYLFNKLSNRFFHPFHLPFFIFFFSSAFVFKL